MITNLGIKINIIKKSLPLGRLLFYRVHLLIFFLSFYNANTLAKVWKVCRNSFRLLVFWKAEAQDLPEMPTWYYESIFSRSVVRVGITVLVSILGLCAG